MERLKTKGPLAFGDGTSSGAGGDRICCAILRDMFGAGATLLPESRPEALKGLFWSDQALSLATVYFPRTALRLTTTGANDASVVILRAMDGPAFVRQKGGRLEAARGDFIFLSPLAPLDIQLPEGGRLDCACLPAHALGTATPLLTDLTMRTAPGDFLPLQLLTSYAGYLLQQPVQSSGEARLMVSHFYALLPLVADGVSERRTPRATDRASAVKKRIERSLTDGTLSLTGLAAEEGLTSRAIQKLFRRDGTTFTRYVLERRLERAKAAILLSSARASIHRIAFDVGFNDLSYFNRTFRKRYGLSPTELRRSGA